MTIKAFIESIQRPMAGGNVRSSFQVHEAEIRAALNRVVAQLLKMDAVNVNFQYGSSIPTHHMVATYDSVPVVDSGCDRSYAILPATPMAMPMQMGIWSVGNCDCDSFVPLEPGMMNIAGKVRHTAMSAILGEELIAYEPSGNKVTFNRSKEQIGETVSMRLLVMDLNSMDEYSQLPIPQDMEEAVFRMVRQSLQLVPHDDSNDGNSSN
jgi:hypothetical protein